jgi:DNA-binding MarR family transcriptional regulator
MPDPENPLAPPDLDVAAVRRGVMHLSRRLRAARGPGALSPSKLSVLSHLASRGAMTPGQLAGVEFQQPQSMTRLLAALEDDGLVERQQKADDRRQFLISVSDDGRRALGADVARRDHWLAEAMATLTGAERDILLVAGRLMESLADLPA